MFSWPQHSTYTWISSSPFISLQSRCDLSCLLCSLFILAIYFLFLLIMFHSLPSLHNSFSCVPSPSSCLILCLYFLHILSFWLSLFTADLHTPLVAAASLLKAQNWLILYTLSWGLMSYRMAAPKLCWQMWSSDPHISLIAQYTFKARTSGGAGGEMKKTWPNKKTFSFFFLSLHSHTLLKPTPTPLSSSLFIPTLSLQVHPARTSRKQCQNQVRWLP